MVQTCVPITNICQNICELNMVQACVPITSICQNRYEVNMVQACVPIGDRLPNYLIHNVSLFLSNIYIHMYIYIYM